MVSTNLFDFFLRWGDYICIMAYQCHRERGGDVCPFDGSVLCRLNRFFEMKDLAGLERALLQMEAYFDKTVQNNFCETLCSLRLCVEK